MELLFWIECVQVWRLEREHAPVKQEDRGQTEDETTIVSYPQGGNE
jgi:hypothetical protein